jgi:hypothetical protein
LEAPGPFALGSPTVGKAPALKDICSLVAGIPNRGTGLVRMTESAAVMTDGICRTGA